MSRRRQAERRQVAPDPIHSDIVITRFTNYLMKDGKRYVAERVVYGAFEKISAQGQNPVEVFHKALDNTKPEVEVRSRRVGGATYQVPVEVRAERALALAMRWLIQAARKRGETTMLDRLGGRIARCRRAARGRYQEARGYAQDGRGQPRLRPLSLVRAGR